MVDFLKLTMSIIAGIYKAVDAKGNAPLVIFALITGPFSLMNIGLLADAANTAREMNPTEKGELGELGEALDLVNKIKGKGACPNKKRRDLPIGSWPVSELAGGAIPGYI
jgi:hypothetical protein